MRKSLEDVLIDYVRDAVITIPSIPESEISEVDTSERGVVYFIHEDAFPRFRSV